MSGTLDPSSADVRTLATKVTGSPCHFIHNTEVEPLSGGEYVVYALESSDGSRVSIRIPENRSNPHTPLLLKREAEIRQRIDNAQLRVFQPLLAFSSTTENSLRAPFLALGWAEGIPLSWSDTKPATEDTRRGVLRSVANASLDLIRINERSRLSLAALWPFLIRRIEETALDWIESKIHRKITRAQAGSLPGGTVAECERQMELTKSYWIPELDTASHVLVHGDLSGNNVIVDGNHCIVQGIIDLGWAELVPLQFAAVYPRFLTHEPVKGEGYDWTARNNEQMEQDRAFYLECVKERALREDGNSMLMNYYRVLARSDEIARYWWLTAASRIDIHRAMVECDWRPPVKGSKQNGSKI